MKALIAIDSFKGCLTSMEAGEAALEAFTEGEAEIIPVSDGGEGFSTILTESLGGTFRTAVCHDPIGRPIKARYGLADSTAIIETAAASGLGLLRKDELNPLKATSYGTGELILDALEYGCEEIWLGLGGSATCDGGTGMLRALGYRFLPENGTCLRNTEVLKDIHEIDAATHSRLLDSCKITGFYDVSVPFCGPDGAARMFAPQKGASPEIAEALDAWLSKLCGTYSRFSGKDVMNIPGAGAAGGIGGALGGILSAKMVPGIDRLLEISGRRQGLESYDLIITGEGKADRQTLHGKVPAGVLEYVKKHAGTGKRPKVILIAGQVSDREQLLDAGFNAVLQITPAGTPLSDALDPANARRNIKAAILDYLSKSLS